MFKYTGITDDHRDDKGIESRQSIIEHTSPTAMYIFVYPTAAKGFGDVDNPEEGKTYCCQGY